MSHSNGSTAIAAALLATVNEQTQAMSAKERACFIAGCNLGLQAAMGCLNATVLAVKNAQLPIIHQPATVREG
jgi:hypothetical protein